MSLQVWLPLNGNTKNLGAACFQPIASDMVYSSFGVLGGQSYYSGSLIMPAEHTKKILNNQEISFSFWLKPYSTINSIIFGNETNEGGGRQFSLFQYSGKGANYHGLALHWSWTFNFESGPNYDKNGNFINNSKDSVIENAFIVGKWTHVCIVYKNPELRIYLDGQLRAVRVAEMQYPSFDYDTQLLRTSGNKDISDFRLYNHALSNAEVKELSKGLILHYTFNDPLLENTTNLDVCKNSMKTQTLEINNGIGANIEFVNFKGDNCFKITINPVAAINYWRGLYMNMNPLNYGAAIGNIVTRSCWMYIPEGQTYPPHFQETIESGATDKKFIQYDYTKPNTWQRVSMTATLSSIENNKNNFLHYFVALNANEVISNKFTFYIKDFQTEINVHPTFYTSNARNYKCIDESGNGYDATQINMSYATQSNCGPVAADFNGTTSGLEIPFIKPDLFTGDCTLNFWVCPREDARGVYLGDYRLTNGSKYSIERRASGAFRFWYNGGTDGKDIDVSALTAPINQWTMLTLVHKASSPLQLTLYKNGNIENKTTITLPEALSEKILGSKLRIGRDERSNDNTPFKGQMSDFRIYATSLSDNDIQELYQTKAYVTNFGDIETGQFIENKDELLITKKYTIETNEMCEEVSNDFEQLEYIQARGGSTGPYINTGVVLNNNSKVVIEFENEGETLANLFGGRKNTTDSVFGMWIEPEAVHPHYGTDNVYNKHSLDVSTLDGKLTYTLNKNIGSCDTVSSISPVATFDCGYSLHLLTMYDSTGIDTRRAKGKLYRCQICNNGVLVRDYIPARRKSDKKIGLYDTINNAFYINNGSGIDFTAGPVLTNSVGSFYINNRISGRNLIEI